MRDHASAPLLGLIWLAACGASPQLRPDTPASPLPAAPSPAAPSPAAPAESPVVEAPSPAPRAVAPTPAPSPDPPRFYPPGIVPDNDHLSAPRDPPNSALARADACERDPSSCSIAPGVLGFHADGRVATIVARELPTCGEDLPPGLAGRVAAQSAFDRGPKTAFTGKRDGGRARAAAFIADRAREGFTPPADLVAFVGEEESGIRGVTSLIGLKAPLAGWMVHAQYEPEAKLRLVDPLNKTAYDLGALTGSGQPSLVQVVLDPEGTHLFVTVSYSDGSHCGADPLSFHRFPLPQAARPAQP